MRSGDKVLMMRLFSLGDELAEGSTKGMARKQKIREAIQLQINTEEIKIALN